LFRVQSQEVPLPFNGSGVFNVVYTFVTDAANGIKILASRQDTQWADVATNGLTNCVTKDGQSTTTAIVPFAGGGIKTDVLSPVTPNGPVSLTAGQLLFPSAANPSTDVHTLDDYEEGTWSPTDGSGSGLTFTVTRAGYIKIGSHLFIDLALTFPVTASGNSATIQGLPFNVPNTSGIGGAFALYNGLSLAWGVLTPNSTAFKIIGPTGSDITNATMSTNTVRCQFSFYAPT
jgi:hypothetical protein